LKLFYFFSYLSCSFYPFFSCLFSQALICFTHHHLLLIFQFLVVVDLYSVYFDDGDDDAVFHFIFFPQYLFATFRLQSFTLFYQVLPSSSFLSPHFLSFSIYLFLLSLFTSRFFIVSHVLLFLFSIFPLFLFKVFLFLSAFISPSQVSLFLTVVFSLAISIKIFLILVSLFLSFHPLLLI
jgi:hypothetical protein